MVFPIEVTNATPRIQAKRHWYELTREPRLGPVAFRRIKRLIDLAVCLSVLPIVATVVVLSVVAIRLDSQGKAFFVQQRTGKGGRRFGMFKLRTMVHNAGELKAKYLHLNELTYPDFKITNDPRMTRVGRVLRKLSIDELPQIINVIRGEMTLVGPRPTSFAATTYRLWHTARLEVRPGLTGLWQVSGRSDLDFDDRLRLDLAYIVNRSLWLDIRILFRTLTAVLSTKGAA